MMRCMWHTEWVGRWNKGSKIGGHGVRELERNTAQVTRTRGPRRVSGEGSSLSLSQREREEREREYADEA